MIQELDSLANKFNLKTVVIDGPLSWLHYRLTVLALLAFSMVGPMISFMGEAISCNPVDDVSEDLLNAFCLVHSTFSVVSAWKKEVGVEVPYPGIDTHVQGQERVFHSYYMWVPVVLAFKAMFFYSPRFLWKTFENGLVHSVAFDLKYPILDEKTRREKFEPLVSYVKKETGRHTWYFVAYVLCQVLYLVNVALQMYFVHLFLGGQFFGYGSDFVELSGWEESVKFNPIVRVFPRMAKCSYFKFSRTGSVDRRNTLCVLPLNLFNEKIYVFLWFWFIGLLILTFFYLLAHITLMLSTSLRLALLSRKVGAKRASDFQESLGSRFSIGDWFFLYLLSRNIEEFTFRNLLDEVSIPPG